MLSTDSSVGNFNDLNNIITGSLNELVLNQDYIYDSDSDANFTSGVVISKNNFILDGKGHCIDGNNKASIFNINGSNVTIKNLIFKNAYNGTIEVTMVNNITFDNITIVNCSSKDLYAGVISQMGDLTVINSKFISNTASQTSDIKIFMGSLTVYNCTFEGGNSNWSHIYTYMGNLIIENSTFTNSNSCYSNAIYSEMTTANIRKSKFNNLTVTETGGAIGMKNDCVFKIVDCEFTNLTAAKDGGAIFADLFDQDKGLFTSNLTIINSIFKNCKSEFGTVMQLSGNLNITDSTFEDNIATFDGAAIWASYANIYIQNSTFKRNNNLMVDLEVGGVLYLDNGNVTIKDSKFIDNHGSNIGDAIYTYDANLILSNNTFADNGNAIYSVFGTNNITQDNIFNNDTISINNTFYSTIIVNNGIEIKLINNTLYFDTLPEKFNLKDYGWLSPIKDQGEMGACWTFGSCGALESALLKATGILYDFSEDSVQNTMLQYSIYGLDSLDEGGDSFTGAGYFINWYGPYPTQLDTYDELGKVSQHLNIENQSIHVQDVIFLPPRENATDNDIFKNALIKYGSLFMCYNAQTDTPYYNVKTSAQYYNGSDDVNHAVSLVGWDDNFSKDNFLITPPGDGAWIVKNSWGTSFGDEGYFYLSYYDNSFIGLEPSLAFLINNTEKYTKNYQTGTGELVGFNENYTYYSNTYTSISDDLIAAVGTYFSDEGTEYELSIYVNDILKHTQNGVSPFVGFHTIKLNENISISVNDTFKVVFKSSNVPYMIYSRQHYQDNMSFASTDGSKWIDMKTLNATAILKVYAIAKSVVPHNLKANVSDETPRFGENITVSHELPDDATGNITYYIDGLPAITLPVNEIFTFTPETPGIHNITVHYNGDDKYSQDEVNLTVDVINYLTIVVDDVYYSNHPIAYVTADYDGNYTIKIYPVNSSSEISSKSTNRILKAPQFTLNVEIIKDSESANRILRAPQFTLDVEIIKGSASVDLGLLAVGDYISEIYGELPGIKTYGDEDSFKVLAINPNLDADISNHTPTYGDEVTVTPILPDDATGNVTYIVDGENMGTLPVNESFTFIPKSDGEDVIEIIYNGEGNYTPDSVNKTIHVNKEDSDKGIIPPDSENPVTISPEKNTTIKSDAIDESTVSELHETGNPIALLVLMFVMIFASYRSRKN